MNPASGRLLTHVASPEFTANVAPATKLVPANVTGTSVPTAPEEGLIDVSVGAVTTPRLALPILFPLYSANQRLPSGPVVIPYGEPPLVGTGNSVMTPAGVIL